MLKEKRENVHSNFATYYDSCINYERNINFNERIKMGKIRFLSISNYTNNNKNLREYKNNKITKNNHYFINQFCCSKRCIKYDRRVLYRCHTAY